MYNYYKYNVAIFNEDNSDYSIDNVEKIQLIDKLEGN